MAGFRKAKAEQAKLKLGIYGAAGSGKTLTSLILAEGLAALDGRRVAVVDTERGTDFYTQDNEDRGLHPAAFDFDALYTRSIFEVLHTVKSLPSDYGVVVIDSISHLWEAAIESYSGNRTSIDTIPMQAWGKIKKPYKSLISLLLNLPVHVIICGRQKNEYTEDAEGKLKKTGTAMRAEGETAHEPHVLVHATRLVSPQRGISLFFEKDRTSLFSGKTIFLEESQPPGHTWKTVGEPFLRVLTLEANQAQVDTADEAALKDIDASTTQDAQEAAEASRLLKYHRAQFELADSRGALDKVSKELTPDVKARLSRDGVAELKRLWLEASARFTSSGV